MVAVAFLKAAICITVLVPEMNPPELTSMKRQSELSPDTLVQCCHILENDACHKQNQAAGSCS